MHSKEDRTEKTKEAIKLMIHTDRMHRKECERRFSSLNIHRSQHMMLLALARMGNGASQKALASELNISPAAAAKTLKKLEHDEMITRSSCSSDARQNDTVITEKGKAIVEESRRIMKGLDAEMVGELSDEELDTLYVLLSKLHTSLSKICEQ